MALVARTTPMIRTTTCATLSANRLTPVDASSSSPSGGDSITNRRCLSRLRSRDREASWGSVHLSFASAARPSSARRADAVYEDVPDQAYVERPADGSQPRGELFGVPEQLDHVELAAVTQG